MHYTAFRGFFQGGSCSEDTAASKSYVWRILDIYTPGDSIEVFLSTRPIAPNFREGGNHEGIDAERRQL
jgi:hypothetical protein